MGFVFDDGGRAASGRKSVAGDCVARSIAIAAQLPYDEVYKALAKGAGSERKTKGASARNGIHTSRKWFKDYMASIGMKWTPTMQIGSGCKVHLDAKELPSGRLVVAVSRHYTAMIDGVIHDLYDPRRESGGTEIFHSYDGSAPDRRYGSGWTQRDDGAWLRKVGGRCVYGYWS